jgi:hypothetical protein
MNANGKSVFVEPTGDPVAACARVWRAGHLGDRPGTTPELVACAAADMPIVVVPGDSGTCAELRLEPLPDDYPASASAFGRAKGVITRDWDLNRPRSACEDPATALEHARALMREADVRGVGVELVGDGPCAGPPSFSEGGTVVQFESYSREQAAERYEVRIRDTLAPLSGKRDCVDPQRGAAEARRLLAAAGVAGITVRVESPAGPCVDRDGYELDAGKVTIRTSGRR